MKNERTETIRQWATLATSTLALLVACLRDPLTLTLKAAVLETLRQELTRYETVSGSEAQWQRHRATANDALERCQRDLSVIRDTVTASATHGRLLVELSNRLASLQTKLDSLTNQP